MIFIFSCHAIRVLLHLLKHLKLVTIRHSISNYVDLAIVFGSLHECHILKYFFLGVFGDVYLRFLKTWFGGGLDSARLKNNCMFSQCFEILNFIVYIPLMFF